MTMTMTMTMTSMTVQLQLDRQIAAVEAAGLMPAGIILNYADHRALSDELGGPDIGYPRPSPYYSFAPSYRGLPIIRPGITYDKPPVVGVAV